MRATRTLTVEELVTVVKEELEGLRRGSRARLERRYLPSYNG